MVPLPVSTPTTQPFCASLNDAPRALNPLFLMIGFVLSSVEPLMMSTPETVFAAGEFPVANAVAPSMIENGPGDEPGPSGAGTVSPYRVWLSNTMCQSVPACCVEY